MRRVVAAMAAFGLVVGAVLLVVLVFEQSGDDDVATQQRLVIGVASDTGVAEVEGLPPRREPAVAALGDRKLFIFGGSPDGDPQSGDLPLSDAYLVDLVARSGLSLPAAPIERLLRPAAASHGSDVLVLGPSCGETVVGESGGYGCSDGRYAAALFDSDRGQWHEVDLPPEIRDTYGRLSPDELRLTELVTPPGSELAVFEIGSSIAPELWSFNFATHSWALLPTVDDAIDYCAASDGQVFALTSSFENNAIVLPTRPKPRVSSSGSMSDGYVLPVMWRYDARNGTWAHGPALTGAKYFAEPRLGCMSDSAAVFGELATDVFARADPQTMEWAHTAIPPAAFGMGSVVWTGRELIALTSEGEGGLEIAAYDPDTAQFRALHVALATPNAIWNGRAAVGYSNLRSVVLVPAGTGQPFQDVASAPGIFQAAL